MNIGSTLQTLLDASEASANLKRSGFFLVDLSGTNSLSSEVMADLGRSSADLADDRFAESLHPEDQSGFRERWTRVSEGVDDNFHIEYRIKDRRSAEWCWVQSHGVVLRRTERKIVAFAGLDQNVTEQKTAEAIIRQQFVDLERIFHQTETLRVAGLLSHTLDHDENIKLVLNHARNLIPFDKASVSQVWGGKLSLLSSVSDESEAAEWPESHPVWTILETKTPEIADDLGSESNYRSWMGIPLIVRDRVLGVLEFWGREPGSFTADQIWPAMGFADSVAESLSNSQEYEGLKEDAQTDALTGLFSRRHLEAIGPKLVETCTRDRQPFAILLLDIDHFKQINDNHGHMVGDAVLMSIAQLCRSLLRQGDLFFRYGGEEFIAILPQTEADVAARIAERLRQITAAARFRGIKNEVTVSVGVAPIAAGHSVNFYEAVEEADQSMYRAKANGRNGVVMSERWTP